MEFNLVETRAQKERKRQEKIIKRLIISVISVCLLLIVSIVVGIFFSPQNDNSDLNGAADWAASDSKDYEGIYVHGGNYDTLKNLRDVVAKYLEFMQAGNFEAMYSGYWDNDALAAHGYKMFKTDFKKEMSIVANKYHMTKSDPKYVDMSYTAVTYQDYTNYYLYTFNLQYTYYGEDGTVKQTPMMEQTYTIFNYENSKGDTYYKLVDFNIHDIGSHASRFRGKDEVETQDDFGI